MTDKKDNQKEMDDFFAQFENVHEEFDKISSNLGVQETAQEGADSSVLQDEEEQPRSFRSKKYRGEEDDQDQDSNKKENFMDSLLSLFSEFKGKIKKRFYIDRKEENPKMSTSTVKLRSKRYKLNLRRLLKTLIIVFGGLFFLPFFAVAQAAAVAAGGQAGAIRAAPFAK